LLAPKATRCVDVPEKDVPFIFEQFVASVPDVVQSPDRSPFVIDATPDHFTRFPLTGLPVPVTPVPLPPIGVDIPNVRSSNIPVITPPDVVTVAIAITPAVYPDVLNAGMQLDATSRYT
jgi:hypothetical protein